MTTITLNTTPNQDKLITQYFHEHADMTQQVLDFILDQIEDQKDLQAYQEAQKEDDGYRVSFEHIMKKYAHEL